MDTDTAGARHTVLAIEFTGLPEEQKLDRLTKDVDCLRLDPLTVDRTGSPGLPELAARVRDGLTNGPPAFVLAYCTAAPLALHLAEACRQRFGTVPHAVLFDPDPGSASYLRTEFAVLCGNLGADPGAALERAAGLDGAALTAALQAELLALEGGLVRTYGGDQDAEDLVAHLLARYAVWLAFLAAGPAAGPAPAEGPVTVITGRPAVDLAALVTDPSRVTVHHCDTRGGPLLHSEAADTTLRALEGFQ
ncbi:hypothetical protein P8A18_01860 [Streptomyces castrisilvae]|uniref:Uncharacterized protein n=1 Tax=Streptomyces castrisilvae TaxID=3033811 RepID=A0ABY9HCN1_9ACTN|nr:hypothetical protein [Streptomyces sp. Mut1]WLQ32267.1 hypothetical protein P8A18_01860 [Streptomyces sp. Mut1]